MVRDIKQKSTYGQKHCGFCMRWMPVVGGIDLVSNDKLSYKWQCNKCVRDKNGKEISN